MEYKKLQIKKMDEKGQFSGYVAVKGNVDSYGDIILDGAFKKTLSEKKSYPILFMHNPEKACGITKSIHEDDRGLFLHGQLDLETELGRSVYSGVKKGYIDCMSIGYTVKDDDMNKKGNRLLKSIDLLECSLITKHFSANSEALVSGFKYSQYKDDSEGESMDSIGLYGGGEPSNHHWDVPGLSEDMKRVHEKLHHLKRMHDDLREDHEHMKRRHHELRDHHEHLKRRHHKLASYVKSIYDRQHYDDWDYYGDEYGIDTPTIFEVEPPGSSRHRRSKDDSFFF